MTLRDLRPGESGTILGFEPSAAINRLMEMGMVPGSPGPGCSFGTFRRSYRS